jgi:hypothetical protein
MNENIRRWILMTFRKCRCKDGVGNGQCVRSGGFYYRGKDLYCLTHGHDTEGYEQVVDRFFGVQFDPSGYHVIHSSYKPGAQCPTWLKFFGFGKYPMRWEKQKCECKRCGTLFWEAELLRLDEREQFLADAKYVPVHQRSTW